ncbi:MULTISPECIES: thermonuclease family protein [Vibrio]|uniref:thermonuclease family protein n=1 Tax=Vibrio TaxID=662 RepID=UPI0001B955EC|nr:MULTISPECIES: hypothetical protein [Vibrio]EEX34285.1 hypothetical protein VIC_001081 [Vibrio coralliilyticus ATCC BAA-450]MDE3898326.1 hypothetical protein [Vibrio sp. CC007]
MGKVIQGNTLKYTSGQLGRYGDHIGSAKQAVHDGDTLTIAVDGNFSIRFLGIDTPETSFEIQGDGDFQSLGTQAWHAYLEALVEDWSDMDVVLGESLSADLRQRLAQPAVAFNHSVHAKRAERQLEALIEADMHIYGLTRETFRFFLPFAYDIVDSYGRLLSYVQLDKRNPAMEVPPAYVMSYNQHLLETGHALPYFIWPNVNPFRRAESVLAAVYDDPETFRQQLRGDHSLQRARTAVRRARESQKGVFGHTQDPKGADVAPLLLEPFELRFLSRRCAPSRPFIDLSADDDVICAPCNYIHTRPEDRLFIPPEYVPLFEQRGWTKQT